MSLNKDSRIHNSKEILQVIRKGRKINLGSILVYHLDTRSTFRIAIIVSSKVSKKAVVRNKIKRRIFAAFRVMPALSSFTGDLIVRTLPGCDKYTYQDIVQRLEKAVKTLGLSE